jgi:probable rRNA maturation factor
MIIDLFLEDPRWSALALADHADKAFRTTLSHLNIDADPCEISLLACDDARIASLNADFRDRDGATNVLSWPAVDLAAETAGTTPTGPTLDFAGDMALGDIAIAFDTCQRESRAADREMADHVTHLLVHGLLHLLGYDHIRDPDATLMMKKEVEILGKLGIGNPYR